MKLGILESWEKEKEFREWIYRPNQFAGPLPFLVPAAVQGFKNIKNGIHSVIDTAKSVHQGLKESVDCVQYLNEHELYIKTNQSGLKAVLDDMEQMQKWIKEIGDSQIVLTHQERMEQFHQMLNEKYGEFEPWRKPGEGMEAFYQMLGEKYGGLHYGREESRGGSGDVVGSALTYGGTAGTLAPFVHGMIYKNASYKGLLTKLGFSVGETIPGQIGLIAAGVGAIVGIMQAGNQEKDAQNKAMSDYVTDQYEGIRNKSMQELRYGSEMAYNIDGGGQWRDILTYREEGFMLEEGRAYNKGMEESIKDMATSYTDLVGKQRRELSQIAGFHEARKDSTKMDIQTDIQSMVFGLERTSDREYDMETQEQISVLAARYKENKAVWDQYNANKDSVTEEELDTATAKLVEVDRALESLAQNAYYKTHIAKLDAEENNQLIDDIQAMSKDTMYTAGYDMGKNLSEGMKEAILKFEPELEEGVRESARKLFGLDLRTGNLIDLDSDGSVTKKDRKKKSISHAYYTGEQEKDPLAVGMNFVPYDGYEATLHWGERVLTASQNRQYSQGGGYPSVLVTGNTFHVRNESDIDEIAATIARKIALYHEIG